MPVISYLLFLFYFGPKSEHCFALFPHRLNVRTATKYVVKSTFDNFYAKGNNLLPKKTFFVSLKCL